MTIEQARREALRIEGAFEGAHQGHPDFRGEKGIFATLWPGKRKSVLRLPMEFALSLEEDRPEIFRVVSKPNKAAWLEIQLSKIRVIEFKELLEIAWQFRAGNSSKS